MRVVVLNEHDPFPGSSGKAGGDVVWMEISRDHFGI